MDNMDSKEVILKAAPEPPIDIPEPPVVPEPKGKGVSGLAIFLSVLLVLVIAGAAYLFYQNLKLREQVTAPTARVTPTPLPSEKPAKKESELTSLDNTWNLYTNHNLKFSMQIPKNIYHSFGSCNWVEVEKSYRPAMGLVPVATFELEDRVFISTTFFYQLGGETVKDGTHYYSECNKVDNSLPKLQDKNVFQQQDWEIIAAKVTNDTELENFIKGNYGTGCKVGEKKASTQEGVFDVLIDTGGAASLEEAEAHGCAINYMYYLKYSPQRSEAITWKFGQSYNFFKTATYDAYDEEMVKSFKFVD